MTTALLLSTSCVALQVKYNVFERGPEKSGLVQACKDLNVALVAHTPLQQGLLTGDELCKIPCNIKDASTWYLMLSHARCLVLPGVLHSIASAGRALEEGDGRANKDQQTVLKLLQFIGAVSGGKTVSQIALSYLIGKGMTLSQTDCQHVQLALHSLTACGLA